MSERVDGKLVNTSARARFPTLSDSKPIRVLHLAPGSGNESLCGKLECINHDLPKAERVAYEALSYEWGSAVKEHSVYLDGGCTVRITSSLNHALHDLRRAGSDKGTRIIWADGICIDQEDIDERSSQVSIMGSIFRLASRVITYIGPERDDSSLAIDFARALLQLDTDRILDSFDTIGDCDIVPILADPAKVHTRASNFPEFNVQRCLALKKLLLRGWAGRAWCAQEFLLNANLILMCGKRVVTEWYLLPEIVVQSFNRKLPPWLLPQHNEDPYSLRECLSNLHTARNNRVELTLVELLEVMHPLRASDPRDKIYSVLSMASDRAALGLEVDYRISVEELYKRTAASIIEYHQSLYILYNCLDEKAFELPSWVPDWSTWKYGTHGTLPIQCYVACGRSKQAYVQITGGGSRLHVRGCLVDRLDDLGDCIGQYYPADEAVVPPERRPWLETQEQYIRSSGRYPDHTAAVTVLWRTLIGNVTSTGNEADEDYEQYYLAHKGVHVSGSTVESNMAKHFSAAARRRSRYRRFARLEKGYFGAVPTISQRGDWICMIGGCTMLFVIRVTTGGFSLVGPAYVHGLMQGEVLEMEDFKCQMLTLI